MKFTLSRQPLTFVRVSFRETKAPPFSSISTEKSDTFQVPLEPPISSPQLSGKGIIERTRYLSSAPQNPTRHNCPLAMAVPFLGDALKMRAGTISCFRTYARTNRFEARKWLINSGSSPCENTGRSGLQIPGFKCVKNALRRSLRAWVSPER